MKRILFAAALACAPFAVHAAPVPMKTEVPPGAYTLDKAHANITFRVSHIGFSNYTAGFSSFDAKLQLDPKKPSASRVMATVDVRSLKLNTPPAGFLEAVLGTEFFEAGRYPTMAFRSTKVEMTAPNKARIAGELTLHGVTKPVTLDATFNGGYAGNIYDPNARIGFSAHTVIKRSQFGMSYGLPPPGSTMGVGDDVDIAIETEFTGPKWKVPKKK